MKLKKSKVSKMYAEEFYESRLQATNWPKDDICDPPTPDHIAIQVLINHLLGPNWYVSTPENHEQTNTAAVTEILHKYLDKTVYTEIGAWAIGLVIGAIITAIVLH